VAANRVVDIAASKASPARSCQFRIVDADLFRPRAKAVTSWPSFSKRSTAETTDISGGSKDNDFHDGFLSVFHLTPCQVDMASITC
jgi:hypothetical protein